MEESKNQRPITINASEARDLIRQYKTLREQMTHAESKIIPLDTAAKLPHVPILKKYLAFSERYLLKLVCSLVAVKNKKDKVVRIMNYNQQLQEAIEECLGPQPGQSGRISLNS